MQCPLFPALSLTDFNPSCPCPCPASSFSGSGALGSVLGLILSGVLLLISWNIVFWIIGVIALPLSIACLFLIPKSEKKVGKNGKLDFVGVGLLTGEWEMKLLSFAKSTLVPSSAELIKIASVRYLRRSRLSHLFPHHRIHQLRMGYPWSSRSPYPLHHDPHPSFLLLGNKDASE